MQVILFDIDGTLIQTGGAGGDALMSAFSDVFRVPDPQLVPFSGRTDRGIARMLFTLHGVDDSEGNWLQLREEYLRRLTEYLPTRQGAILPGIPQLLELLSQQSDVAVGLLTGNLRDGARRKLEHFGLQHHFSFGGFGDRHADRDDVAREALVASREHVSADLPADQIWVIGDTPFDVRCARAIGARAVAVATGWDSREELAASQPDMLFDSLDPPEVFLHQVKTAMTTDAGDTSA